MGSSGASFNKTGGVPTSNAASMRGAQKTIAATRKLMEAPQRLLHEEDINEIVQLVNELNQHQDLTVKLNS